jgi:hypothetical protein
VKAKRRRTPAVDVLLFFLCFVYFFIILVDILLHIVHNLLPDFRGTKGRVV